jgi:hypothetical protein
LLADGTVLLAESADATGTITDACEAYNPAANTWSATATVNEARVVYQSILLSDGRVLVMEGEVCLKSAGKVQPACAESFGGCNRSLVSP